MMELTQAKTIKIVAVLLLLSAITQPIYTALFLGAPDVASRQVLWGLEGLLFVFLVAFAGSALVMAKRYTLGFSAIAFSAVLNVVQVGVGYTLFKPFGQAAQANAELGAISFSVVVFGFFIYNAAKILLGLAAVVFGVAHSNQGRKALGGLTALVGAVAIVANAIVLMLGIKGVFPSPIAGGSGVAATLLLAICLLSLNQDD
ncbi:MAG: hypothetical protein ABJM43_11770 [Paracoccaceae bacterium]